MINKDYTKDEINILALKFINSNEFKLLILPEVKNFFNETIPGVDEPENEIIKNAYRSTAIKDLLFKIITSAKLGREYLDKMDEGYKESDLTIPPSEWIDMFVYYENMKGQKNGN